MSRPAGLVGARVRAGEPGRGARLDPSRLGRAIGKVGARPSRSWRTAAAIVVLVLALWPRLADPSPFLTWDEPVWTYRSLHFLRALQVGRWADTNLTDHPGVLTMWAGAAGIVLRGAWEPAADLDLAWVDALPPFDEDDPSLLDDLVPWWPWARAAVGVLTALIVAGAVLALARVHFGVAVVAGVLLAFDPYLLGHSRVLQLDAVLSLALVLSVLLLVAHLEGPGGGRGSDDAREAGTARLSVGARGAGRRMVAGLALLAGAFAGVAALEKSPGLVIAPFTALVVVAYALADGRPSVGAIARTLGLWALGAGAAYALVWPAMWADPAGTIAGMWAYATGSAAHAREAVFYRGTVVGDPGIGLYLFAVAHRLTPVAVAGLVAFFVTLPRQERTVRRLAAVLVAFAVVYVAFMGTNAKKFERYALPAVVALDVVAAVGLAGAVTFIGARGPRARRDQELSVQRDQELPARLDQGLPALEPRAADRRRPWAIAAALLLAGLLVAQAADVARRSPYYLAWYSPLLGGGPMAAERLPVGWGEAMDRAAAWLNARTRARDLVVATPSVGIFAPLFVGRTVPARDWADADYVVLYVDDVQIGRPDLVTAFHGVRRPEHVVRVGGIEYAWVYRVADP